MNRTSLCHLLQIILFVLILSGCTSKTDRRRPKLVVGIVVDQLRWDYLYRYSDKFAQNGLKRLMREGYSCENAHINYFPAYTGPGHACIYTGSVPAIHGIAGNAWYDRSLRKKVNCIEDPTAELVGFGGTDGQASPRNLLVTTITDQLQLSNNFQSKVVSLALKDRGAILPGGHHPNGAYYVDGATGYFITTSYYMKKLPSWVVAFNKRELARKYLDQDWNTLLPINQYLESTPDDEAYETTYPGEVKPVFPHHLAKMSQGRADVISNTPFGNTLTLDFAQAAIEGENMGQGKFTDFLAVSLSATDLVGHQFGPNSIEAEDCALRLDNELGIFFTFLDKTVGKGNYLVFLTADHGVNNSTGFLAEHQIPGGSFNIDSVTAGLNNYLVSKLGEGRWILDHENMEFYLNQALLDEKKISREEIFHLSETYMMNYSAIANLVDLQNLPGTTLPPDLKNLFANGFNVVRSGDFQIVYNSGWVEDFRQGATHGTGYTYDTHIPLLWMGWKVKHGEDHTAVYMTDIAPTLAAMLHIQEPSGSVGKVITKLTDK